MRPGRWRNRRIRPQASFGGDYPGRPVSWTFVPLAGRLYAHKPFLGVAGLLLASSIAVFVLIAIAIKGNEKGHGEVF